MTVGGRVGDGDEGRGSVGERTAEGGGDDGRGRVGDGDEGRGSDGDEGRGSVGERTVEGGGDDGRGRVGDGDEGRGSDGDEGRGSVGERTVEGGGDDGRGRVGDGDEGRGSVGERTVERGGDDARGSVGDESTEQGGAVVGRGIGDSKPMPPEPRRVPEASNRLSFPESDKDIGQETDSEFQLSDTDARNDFLGFEEREDLVESDESEEKEISFDEGRGRVPTSRRSRRPRRPRTGRSSVSRSYSLSFFSDMDECKTMYTNFRGPGFAPRRVQL